jgi:hypothetical protein
VNLFRNSPSFAEPPAPLAENVTSTEQLHDRNVAVLELGEQRIELDEWRKFCRRSLESDIAARLAIAKDDGIHRRGAKKLWRSTIADSTRAGGIRGQTDER